MADRYEIRSAVPSDTDLIVIDTDRRAVVCRSNSSGWLSELVAYANIGTRSTAPAAAPTKASCQECRFAEKITYGHLQCRRRPPIAWARDQQRWIWAEGGIETARMFPIMHANDWCGEFEVSKG